MPFSTSTPWLLAYAGYSKEGNWQPVWPGWRTLPGFVPVCKKSGCGIGENHSLQKSWCGCGWTGGSSCTHSPDTYQWHLWYRLQQTQAEIIKGGIWGDSPEDCCWFLVVRQLTDYCCCLLLTILPITPITDYQLPITDYLPIAIGNWLPITPSSPYPDYPW